MNLLDIISALYRSEINSGLQTDWDGGFRVWLGHFDRDELQVEWFGVDQSADAAEWLDQAARSQYPESDYAKS